MASLKKEKNFTQGALIPQILLFSLPLIATSVLQLLFNTADTVVVGRWGGESAAARANSLAAVGSCSALITLLVNLFFGLSVGAGISVAHDIGAAKEDEARKTIHTSVILALASGALVTLVGLFAAEPLLSLMGTDPELLDEASRYMRAYFCGMPANMLYTFCAAILRAKGETVRPLIFLSVAGVANVLLNLLTVVGFGWGAVGVGTATAVSQWISCILIVVYMMRIDGVCRIDLRELRVHRDKLLNVLRIGLPAGIQSSFFSISNVLVQSTINTFGPVVVAGNTAALNIEGYGYVIQNAFYQAALTFVAQNAGAGNIKRIKRVAWHCSWLVCAAGLAVGAVCFLSSHLLLGIYAPGNEAVIAAGATRMAVICLPYFLCGLMEVGGGCMRGLGKSALPTIVALIGSCLLRIVWIYTVFAWVPVPEGAGELYRLSILYLSYPVSWAITALTHYICFLFTMRRFRQTVETRG